MNEDLLHQMAEKVLLSRVRSPSDDSLEIVHRVCEHLLAWNVEISRQ
jgi:hypothetical protein